MDKNSKHLWITLIKNMYIATPEEMSWYLEFKKNIE